MFESVPSPLAYMYISPSFIVIKPSSDNVFIMLSIKFIVKSSVVMLAIVAITLFLTEILFKFNDTLDLAFIKII